LTRASAAKTVDIMRGVLRSGTARRTPLADERPAGGKTGTQANNTNAWFVGFTPQYSTVVWVGDPRGYTPMRGVPEFRDQIVGTWGFARNTVTGATYPAHIWKLHMDKIHESLEVVDWGTKKDDEEWKALVAPARPVARLYLPGVECVAQVMSGTPPAPSTTLAPGRTTTTTLADPATTTTVAAPVVVSVLPTSTTIDPTEKNPFAPVPSIPAGGNIVYDCAKGVPNWAQTSGVGG
jgi:penicillin-binding protein 1A